MFISVRNRLGWHPSHHGLTNERLIFSLIVNAEKALSAELALHQRLWINERGNSRNRTLVSRLPNPASSLLPLPMRHTKFQASQHCLGFSEHGNFWIVHKTDFCLSYINQLQCQDHEEVFHEQLILTKSFTTNSFIQYRFSSEYLSISHIFSNSFVLHNFHLFIH